MTTGPAGRTSTSVACTARSPTAASRPRSRSAADGWSSGRTPGSTTSASCAAAPNDDSSASTPTLTLPPPSSRSVHSCVPPGSCIAGTAGQDRDGSADLLADALSGLHRQHGAGRVEQDPLRLAPGDELPGGHAAAHADDDQAGLDPVGGVHD